MRWSIRARQNRGKLILLVLSILCLLVLQPTPSVAQEEYSDLTGIKVAVYNGVGVMGSSRIALYRMFEWMNATAGNITASEILAGELDDYDILVVPGGSEDTCSDELESEGQQIVKDFVAGGGSYFGICGGATFGARYLHLFNGFMGPVSEPGDLIHITTMHVNRSSLGPDLSDLAENLSIMYYASQRFTPNPYAATSIHTIARYDYDGSAGMVAFEYDYGTVFLSSPHPEYEENGDRDGTTFGDYLEDPDSEWELLFRVSKWLIEASSDLQPESETTTTPTTTATGAATTPDVLLFTSASLGIGMIVLGAALVYRRTHK
jgi:glutamine amidotransferase-like uncharacterized protein